MLVTINCLDSLAGRLPPSTHCARLLKNAGDMVELAKRDHWQALESWSWGSLPYLEARCSRMAPLSNSFRSPEEVGSSWNSVYGTGPLASTQVGRPCVGEHLFMHRDYAKHVPMMTVLRHSTRLTILHRRHLAPWINSQVGRRLVLLLFHVKQYRLVGELHLSQNPLRDLPSAAWVGVELDGSKRWASSMRLQRP